MSAPVITNDLFAAEPGVILWRILPDNIVLSSLPHSGFVPMHVRDLKSHLMDFADQQEIAHEGVSSLHNVPKIRKALESLN
jgi:hypothetical protein